jgi:hypothetical protein
MMDARVKPAHDKVEHDPEKWVTGFPNKIMLKQEDRAG